jgi:hypothetical protein
MKIDRMATVLTLQAHDLLIPNVVADVRIGVEHVKPEVTALFEEADIVLFDPGTPSGRATRVLKNQWGETGTIVPPVSHTTANFLRQSEAAGRMGGQLTHLLGDPGPARFPFGKIVPLRGGHVGYEHIDAEGFNRQSFLRNLQGLGCEIIATDTLKVGDNQAEAVAKAKKLCEEVGWTVKETRQPDGTVILTVNADPGDIVDVAVDPASTSDKITVTYHHRNPPQSEAEKDDAGDRLAHDTRPPLHEET